MKIIALESLLAQFCYKLEYQVYVRDEEGREFALPNDNLEQNNGFVFNALLFQNLEF